MLLITVIVNFLITILTIAFLFIFQNLSDEQTKCILKPDDCESNINYSIGLIFIFNILFLAISAVLYTLIIVFRVIFNGQRD